MRPSRLCLAVIARDIGVVAGTDRAYSVSSLHCSRPALQNCSRGKPRR